MGRKIAVIALLSVLILSLFAGVVAGADGEESVENTLVEKMEEHDPDKYVDEEGNRLSYFERNLARVMWKFMLAVVKLFRLDAIETLIFSSSVKTETGVFQSHDAPEVGGIFYAEEWEKIIKPGYILFRNIALALLGISVVWGGMKIATKSSSPVGRAEIKEMFIDWIVTAVGIGIMLTLVIFVMDINSALVAGIGKLIDPGLISSFGEGDSTLVTMRLTESFETGSWFFTFFAYLYMTILIVYFNFLYLLRKFLIMVLIIVGPLVLWSWSKGHQTSLWVWASEVVSNILMQSAHALVFVVYFNIAAHATRGFMGSPIGKTLLLLMLVPAATLLRSLITGWFGIIGLNEEKTAGGVFGGVTGGVAALAGSGGGIIGAFTSRGGGGSGGARGQGSWDRGEESGKYGKAGSIASKTLGVTGAVAGGVLGAAAAPVFSSFGAGSAGEKLASAGRDFGKAAGAPFEALGSYIDEKVSGAVSDSGGSDVDDGVGSGGSGGSGSRPSGSGGRGRSGGFTAAGGSPPPASAGALPAFDAGATDFPVEDFPVEPSGEAFDDASGETSGESPSTGGRNVPPPGGDSSPRGRPGRGSSSGPGNNPDIFGGMENRMENRGE